MFKRNRPTATTDRARDDRAEMFHDRPTFGIDLSGATAERRADSKRSTLRPMVDGPTRYRDR